MRQEITKATLKDGHWNPEIKTQLEELITNHAGQGKKVYFDFDNTLICRDIGEATLAAMVAAGKFTLDQIPPGISPDFTREGESASLKTVKNIVEYYDFFQKATTHHSNETAPSVNAYVWLIQIMAGMSPDEIIEFTEKGFADGKAARDMTDPALGQTQISGFLQPFFYPEMIDLVGTLLKHGYKVHIVSASNIWTVRWMVLNQLNPILKAKYSASIPPKNVAGVSVLMRDRRNGELYKDPLLVRENEAYASLLPVELANYKLTTQVVYPVSSYIGKVGTIQHYFSWERPFLAAGDSPNDHAMLRWAENQLWILRLEKTGYLKPTIDHFANQSSTLMTQPVLYSKAPGFVRNQTDLENRLRTQPDALNTSLTSVKKWQTAGKLSQF